MSAVLTYIRLKELSVSTLVASTLLGQRKNWKHCYRGGKKRKEGEGNEKTSKAGDSNPQGFIKVSYIYPCWCSQHLKTFLNTVGSCILHMKDLRKFNFSWSPNPKKQKHQTSSLNSEGDSAILLNKYMKGTWDWNMKLLFYRSSCLWFVIFKEIVHTHQISRHFKPILNISNFNSGM